MAKLTNKFIDNLEMKKQSYIVWDDEIKGLGIRINELSKRFILKYRIGHGRKAIIKKPILGKYNILRTEEARRVAREWLLVASQGKDPCEKKSDQTTIKEFCDIYIERHAKIKKKESSMIEDQRMIRLQIISYFGKLKVTDVTRPMVLKHHESLYRIPYTANRFLSLLSKMMNLAEKWEFRPLYSNPCKHVDRYKEKPREVYLMMDELERVGSAMRELKDIESEYALSAIQMLILTGSRTGEILSLKWEYIDFENCCMNLPDTKTGERKIHLNPSALSILKSLEKKSEYVFVSRVENKRITTIRLTWKKICKIAGLSDVRLHDLRHNFASYAVNNGFSLPIIAKMLGHKDLKTTQRYAHLHQDPVNKASDDISLKIKKVMEME